MSISFRNSCSATQSPTSKSTKRDICWALVAAGVATVVAASVANPAMASTISGSRDTTKVVSHDNTGTLVASAPQSSSKVNTAPSGVMSPQSDFWYTHTVYASGTNGGVKDTVSFHCVNGRVSDVRAYYTTKWSNWTFSSWAVQWGACNSTTHVDFYYRYTTTPWSSSTTVNRVWG